MSTKTYTPRAAEVEAQREWYVIDAAGQNLGRLATAVAQLLRGKHKPTFSPHLDMGDYVIVVNADKVVVSGKKAEEKMYYRHSGYMGGLKAIPFAEMLKKHPTLPVEEAVRGMIPHNRLGSRIMRKLKVYAGPDHPHAAQQPKPVRINADTGEVEIVQESGK
jgi:large subunit ribosomal protein L13